MRALAGRLEARALRLACAVALGWALLLAGWIGLASLSQRLASGPWPTFALLAGWVLVLGFLRLALAAGRLPDPVRRRLLPCAAGLAAALLFAALRGSGALALWLAMAAWAALVTLASTAIDACGPGGRPGRAVVPAAAGALLAWLLLGDIGDLQSLGARLMVGAPVAGVLLVVVLPRCAAAVIDARGPIGDCALPAGALAAWRTPRQWPLLLASAAMLPMMCGLPWMVELCREGGLSAQGVLGLHLLAMFAPALLFTLLRIEVRRAAPLLCALLLVAGAMAFEGAPAALGGWGLTLAHGAAWSVAWQVRMTAPPAGSGSAPAVLAASGLGAALVLLLGLGVSLAGLQAFGAWQVVSAVGAAAGCCAMLARESRPHDLKKRRRIVQAREGGAP
jgi:hypothetical protein